MREMGGLTCPFCANQENKAEQTTGPFYFPFSRHKNSPGFWLRCAYSTVFGQGGILNVTKGGKKISGSSPTVGVNGAASEMSPGVHE